MSLTTITPFAICVAMTGVTYSLMGTSAAEGSTDTVNGFLALAVPIFVVTGVGGIANIAMVGHTRNQESALLSVIGARPGTVLATAVWEGFIYAFTGILFGLIATVIAVVTGTLLAGGGPAQMVAATPFAMLGPLCLVVLLIAIATVIAPTVAAGRRPVMENLRRPA